MTFSSSYSAIATVCLGITSASFGAGFQLQERSSVGLGRAFSGEAAIADDASVLASNPAGLIKLDDTSVSVGLSYIHPGAKARGTTPGPTGSAVEVRSDDVGDKVVVPSLYLSKRLNDDLAVGLGLFTTYGLSTDYNFSGPGIAPLANTSTLESVNLNIAFAYKVADNLTIGAGFNTLYAEGVLNASFPQSSLPVSNLKAFELAGDDIGYGYNIGVLYEITESTRIGLHYRSKVKLKLSGETDLVGNPALSFPGLSDQETSLSVTLPETLEASLYHEINNCWALHGDILWTRWSRYEGLSPNTGNSVADAILDRATEYDDVFRYSVGATYIANDKLTLRTGVAFDRSPVHESDRGLRIPDEDRIWVSIGASYAVSENYSLDVGYTHIFISDAEITDSRDGFAGQVSGDVDILSVGISGEF